MEQSIFLDKANIPTDENLKQALGTQYELWMEIRARVFEKYPDGREDWKLLKCMQKDGGFNSQFPTDRL